MRIFSSVTGDRRQIAFQLALVFTFIILSLGCSRQAEDYTPEVQIVKEEGVYTILRNGSPFVIQGVAGHEHLARLKQMGGNTIRVYDTNNLSRILDSAHAYDIAVIAGIWMMGDLEMDYNDSFLVAQQYLEVQESVRKYRDHPALLMWCLGNEISY